MAKKNIQTLTDEKLYKDFEKAVLVHSKKNGTPVKLGTFIRTEFIIPFLKMKQTLRQIQNDK